MKTLFAIVLALFVSGCSTTKMFENRVVCTADKKELHVISKWGRLGIGSQIADADAKVVCK